MIIFENETYQVLVLEEPVSVNQNGIELFFNYDVFCKESGRSESLAQFLPSAIDLATNLALTLKELREVPDVEGLEGDNIVTLK